MNDIEIKEENLVKEIKVDLEGEEYERMEEDKHKVDINEELDYEEEVNNEDNKNNSNVRSVDSYKNNSEDGELQSEPENGTSAAAAAAELVNLFLKFL